MVKHKPPPAVAECPYVTAVAHVAPAAVTQKLARHKSYETTRHYLLVADSAAREAVEAATMRPIRVGDSASTSTQEFHTGAETEAHSGVEAGNEKALDPLGSKAFPPVPAMVGATGFEPATPRPPV